MSKIMRATPLEELLERIAGEYRAKSSIYEIPEKVFRKSFELESRSPGLSVMGGRASLPVGPAAGPHSQIAPNLVAAYLAGARAFELKTVQENDALDIEKPCIDALDEGHNVEWSTELSLVDAREEYLRGWIAVNLLSAIYSEKPRDFFFNISVGYTLDGIKGKKVDAYLEGMRRPAAGGYWQSALSDLQRFVEGPSLRTAFGSEAASKARKLLDAFPPEPIHSVTLSTMHGCPPAEIERIGRYLLEEKGFDVYIKLNPTLLGYDKTRVILDATGWKDIEIRRESFERDLQWKDALSLIASLRASAAQKGRCFGIKLSNTLANANTAQRLPGNERYMSGRALFPITIRLAADLAAALPDFDSRFSYCGGVQALNAYELIGAGLGPLTVATDVLKPGGYLRFASIAEAAVAALPDSRDRPDPARLTRLAEDALERPEYRKGFKPSDSRIAKDLPLFDCFAAPCIEACPAHQKVPEYLRLAAGSSRGKEAAWDEALATICADNALPRITGVLCDHACQSACSRLDYEGPVRIRDVKLACSRAGSRPDVHPTRSSDFPGKVAVLGAGPAGLSCAYYLALSGIRVVVFEKASSPGGVPANVIPRFRITREDIATDIDHIASLGVEFRFGIEVKDIEELRQGGYTAVFVGTGSPIPRSLKLSGAGISRIDALSFLERVSEAEGRGMVSPFIGTKRISVAGGGNTAMDAARAALRIPGMEEVRLLYRRTRAEMPADKAEVEEALGEGAVLEELALPESADASTLTVRRMILGSKDASGRRSPEPSDKTFTIACDLLIEALGESCDTALLERLGVAVGEDGKPTLDRTTRTLKTINASDMPIYSGGDLTRGPASIIAACADGKKAAYAMLRGAGIEPNAAAYRPPRPDASSLARRGRLSFSMEEEATSADFAAREAERCLECDSACLRCVEVCPNRANIAIPVTSPGSPFAQSLQILHVDALCNECGNCGFFCPYSGEPFHGKATLFSSRAVLETSHNAGFAIVVDTASQRESAEPRRDARPRLVFRATPGGPIASYSYEEWGLAEASESNSKEFALSAAMAALAGTVLRDHPYLFSGGNV